MNDPISAMNVLNYVASIKKLFSDIEKWSKYSEADKARRQEEYNYYYVD